MATKHAGPGARPPLPVPPAGVRSAALPLRPPPRGPRTLLPARPALRRAPRLADGIILPQNLE